MITNTNSCKTANLTKVYTFYNEIYYDSLCQNYYNIITINKMPEGNLKNYIKTIKLLNPSTKLNNINNFCSYAINNKLFYDNNIESNINNSISTNKNNLILTEEVDSLYEFLINNNYIIDTHSTKFFKNNILTNNSKKILFIVKYKIDN